jgi:hypothetical protein
VKLSSKLLEAYKQFCHQTGRGLPDTAASQTEAAIQYIHDAYVYQESWLEQFKARKETAMNFISFTALYIEKANPKTGV